MEINYIQIIPLIEKENENFIVRFNDIESLNEEYGWNYKYIIQELAFNNNINKNNIIVAINESDIILNPKIVLEFQNIVIVPISENNRIFQLCEDCIDAFLGSENEIYIDAIINESKLGEIVRKVKRENNINKIRPHIAKNAYQTKKSYTEEFLRFNILTGKINYLHESKNKQYELTYDLRDFAGPHAKEKMVLRLQHAYKSVLDNNRKAIAEKIAALNRLGNRLKGKEELTTDIEKKGIIQRAFDKVKNAAKTLLNKITPSFLQ